MKLVIVESPAKCSTIEGYLGKEYKCIASFGHIRELLDLSCIDKKNNYHLTFKESNSKLKQIQKIKELIKKADEVIIATDDDREGEGIGWHLCEVFSLNVETTKRIIFNEITKPALEWAINNPTKLDMNKVNAQLARQTLDMLVGYQLSPVLWKHISRNKGLSAGRCQSPALRILYENQQEINNTVGDNLFNVNGMFTSRCITFSLDKEFKEYKTVSAFLENSVNHKHMYNVTPIRKCESTPPLPFTTSTLQQRANSTLRSSPKETMSTCQKLYEAGLITYMRTDNCTYSEEFTKHAHKYITANWGDEYVLQTMKVTKGAHEAIRVTDPNNMYPKLESRENNMYRLIWENTMESCMSSAQYNAYTAEILAVDGFKFKYRTEKNIFPGWKIIKGGQLDDEYYAYLQTLQVNQVVAYKQINAIETVKNLKQHYTEAKLVSLLEKEGIGRPSTFSSIIEKIQTRGYVVRGNVEGKKVKMKRLELVENEITESESETLIGAEKNKLIIQDTGKLVIEFLMKSFEEFVDYGYTREMENNLDNVACGKTTPQQLSQECDNIITHNINIVVEREKDDKKKSGHIKLDAEHTYMVGKYGPIVKKMTADVTTWLKVREGLDIKKLESGGYSLYDVIINCNKESLGLYNGYEIKVYSGKYGLYTKYNDNNITLTCLGKKEEDITLQDIIPIIEKPKTQTSLEMNKTLQRELTKSMNIRTGKYGDYIYYKTDKMSKPKFLNFKGYTGEYMTDSKDDVIKWIKTRHKII
jgi:DNA topoisomerase-1